MSYRGEYCWQVPALNYKIVSSDRTSSSDSTSMNGTTPDDEKFDSKALAAIDRLVPHPKAMLDMPLLLGSSNCL
jgi:hypothetical protein